MNVKGQRGALCKQAKLAGRRRPLQIKKPPTFKRRKSSIQDEFQIAELTFGKDDRRKSFSFFIKLLAPWRIARDEIFQDPACESSRQCAILLGFVGGWFDSLPCGGFAIFLVERVVGMIES